MSATDTIDVAALVERLRSHEGIGAALAHDRGQTSRFVTAIMDEAATALQSQADALAEARGEDDAFEESYKDAYGKVDYAAMAHALSGRLRQMDKRAKAANKRADLAEASLATMREALEAIEKYPAEGNPRRNADGYPKEVVYDEYAYRRLIDAFREVAGSALAKEGK